MEEKQESEQDRLNYLAEELDRLQAVKNNGRGVNHLRYIVDDLRRGDLPSARADIRNQSDKFDSIPDLKEWVRGNLFDKDQSPWDLDADPTVD